MTVVIAVTSTLGDPLTPAARRSLVLGCQTTLAAATVAVVSLPAMSVVQLEIVPPPPVTQAATPAERAAEGAMVSTTPVDPTVEDVDLESDRVQVPAERYEVLTRAIPVEGYATVGVTWAAGAAASAHGEDEITVELRTRDGGAWSAWEPVSYDPDHTPDPGAGADAVVRPGTDAMVVGAVDEVQVRVSTGSGAVPDDLELAVIDPGDEPAMELQAADHAATAASGLTGDEDGGAQLVAASPAKPTIFSRAQWGANEKLRDGSPRYGTIRAGFVHHTVNANGYTRAQVPAIIRGIYAYHTQSRGWSDIGYNFLVDRFGRIWEGRYGGVARPVIGAHTLGYNEYSFAMSAIGNYETAIPNQAMLNAYAKLFAWKLSLHGVRADDGSQKLGSRYFKAINGHRDAGQTACPGRNLYAKLATIRTRATKIQAGSPPPPEPKPEPKPEPTADPATRPVTTVSGSPWPDIVTQRADGRLMITRTEGQYKFERSVRAAKEWGRRDLLVVAGDVTGDGHGDVIARDAGTGRSGLYPGDGNGGVRPAARGYTRFARLDQLVGVGDLDDDGQPDLVGRVAATKTLRFYAGKGNGGFRRARRLAETWHYDTTVGVGDLDGDGHPDLLARRGKTMFFVRSQRGALREPRALKGSWARFDLVAGGGDLTGDGRPDVMARSSATKLSYLYPGDGRGGFGKRHGTFIAFRQMKWFALADDVKGDGPLADAIGVHTKSGALRVFGNTDRRNLGATAATDVVLDPVDTVLAIGDWDLDGHGDLMYREKGSSNLMFLAGRGHDRFAAPVVAATRLQKVTGLAAAGDLTGDGRPDLIGQNARGYVRVYPGNGRSGFGTSFRAARGSAAPAGVHRGVLHRRRDQQVWRWMPSTSGGPLTGRKVLENAGRYDWFLALGDVDGNGRPDIVARARATGQLWLLPGNRQGLAPRRYVGALPETFTRAAR